MAARQEGAKLSNEAAQTAPGHGDRALAGLKFPNFELKMHTPQTLLKIRVWRFSPFCPPKPAWDNCGWLVVDTALEARRAPVLGSGALGLGLQALGLKGLGL